VRDEVVDLVEDWSKRTEIDRKRFITWVGIARGKYFAWRERYGKVNEHNAKVRMRSTNRVADARYCFCAECVSCGASRPSATWR
jgi:hypothetical protein